MGALEDDKYVVMQREQFEFMMHVAQVGIDETIILKDAVVIRTQDIFSGPGLSAYAMDIQTALDLNAVMGGTVFTLEQAKRLAVMRDYFYVRAQEAFEKAAEGAAKVPD